MSGIQVYQASSGVPAIQEQALTTEMLVRQVNIVKNAMKAVMRQGHHFDKIPGCGDKPVLLKPGAEIISVTFRFSPEYKIDTTEMAKGHREYSVVCNLIHGPTGGFIGQGLGSCSTMESKYRYRAGAGTVTDIAVPKAYWDARTSDPSAAAAVLRRVANEAGIEGAKFSTKKDDTGVWRIATFADKVEHDNPADYYNTCLKMAKKRAFVDAILTATAASEIFTQDLDDNPAIFGGKDETRRLNLVAIKDDFDACQNMEELDSAVQGLMIDKQHPEAPKVNGLYQNAKRRILAEKPPIQGGENLSVKELRCPNTGKPVDPTACEDRPCRNGCPEFSEDGGE